MTSTNYIFLDALETKQEVESEKKATDIFFTHGGIKRAVKR